MLQELTIRNFALIEHLHVRFGPGFNVLTGETGAGKSILIDAISRVLGGRASPDDIRTGADQAWVEAIFALPDRTQAPAMHELLASLGLLDDEADATSGEGCVLILAREINRTGRGVARINGRAFPVSTVSTVGEQLVDIHGQHEHISLLRAGAQLDFLDRFGGLVSLRDRMTAVARELRGTGAALVQLRADERELARRADLLRYQMEEIASARLTPGEDVELERERTLLLNAERLAQLAGTLYEALAGGNEDQRAVLDLLGVAERELATLVRIDPAEAAQRRVLQEAAAQIDELAHHFRAYQEAIEFSPDHLVLVEERWELLRSLKRKYGDTIEAIIEFGRQAAEQCQHLTNYDEQVAELERREGLLLSTASRVAAEISRRRTEASQRLASSVQRELAGLNLRGVFEVGVQQAADPNGLPVELPDSDSLSGAEGDTEPGPDLPQGTAVRFSETGIDQVEFRIALNPGEPSRPMARIASGGELSRILLALKSVVSEVDGTPTLIFDEVDVGVGGRSGQVIAEKLFALAARHQVLCVTHLPQIAAMGEHHFLIAKREQNGRTITDVRQLADSDRLEELAQMLGGITVAALGRASELLSRAPKRSA